MDCLEISATVSLLVERVHCQVGWKCSRAGTVGGSHFTLELRWSTFRDLKSIMNIDRIQPNGKPTTCNAPTLGYVNRVEAGLARGGLQTTRRTVQIPDS